MNAGRLGRLCRLGRLSSRREWWREWLLRLEDLGGVSHVLWLLLQRIHYICEAACKASEVQNHLHSAP